MSAKPKTQLDELDAFVAMATIDPTIAVAMCLWKNRFHNPDLFLQIVEQDIIGYQACMDYLKVKPAVHIERPPGLPAYPGIPASHGQRAVPARSASPPKPYVQFILTDQQGNAIKPVENNSADYDLSQDAAKVRKAKDQAQDIADRLQGQMRSGDYSASDVQDAVDALILLGRAG